MDDSVSNVLYVADSRVDGVAGSFLTALESYKEDVDYDALIEAIGNDDFGAVEKAINEKGFDFVLAGIVVAAGASFTELIQESFVAGAKTALSELTDLQTKTVSFDLLGERGTSTIRTQVATVVKEATTTTQEGLRKLLETKAGVLDDLKRQSQEIVKMLGLTSNQVTAVSNYRKQLEARKVFDLTNPANRKIDAIDRVLVQQHMSVGGLSKERINGLVDNYRKNLLTSRALSIARTEVLSAVHAGRQELWEQAIDQGVFDVDDVRKYWIVTPDDKLRATHAAIPIMNPNGVKIRAFFVTPFGNVYGPQDSLVDLINCRCVIIVN